MADIEQRLFESETITITMRLSILLSTSAAADRRQCLQMCSIHLVNKLISLLITPGKITKPIGDNADGYKI